MLSLVGVASTRNPFHQVRIFTQGERHDGLFCTQEGSVCYHLEKGDDTHGAFVGVAVLAAGAVAPELHRVPVQRPRVVCKSVKVAGVKKRRGGGNIS